MGVPILKWLIHQITVLPRLQIFCYFFCILKYIFFIVSNYVTGKSTPTSICFYLHTIISKTFHKYSQYHALSDEGAPTLSNRLHIGVRVWECEFTWVSYFTTGPFLLYDTCRGTVGK